MTRPRRLALLLLPAGLGVLLAAFPGHAQQSASNSRYAFADTTLLRDTLGLKFDRIFPLADSLTALGQSVLPDTIRALAIRYKMSPDSVVGLARKENVGVDTLGSYLERERYNPLSNVRAATGIQSALHYTSGYTIAQTSTSWINGLDYKRSAGAFFVQNVTNVQMDRYLAGGRTSLRQTRSSSTETGWKLGNDLSLGARANLDGFVSKDPGSISNQSESKNEFQFSMRSRRKPAKGIVSDINFFSGLLNLDNYEQVKRGASGDLNGTLRIQTRYVTHDLSGQVNGNLASTRRPGAPKGVGTSDLSENVRGTLGFIPNGPVGLNLNYSIRRIRVETLSDSLPPLATPVVDRPRPELVRPWSPTQGLYTNSRGADVALRLRRGNDQYLNLTAKYSKDGQNRGTGLNSRSNSTGISMGADGRALLAGWDVQSRFSLAYSRSEYPTRAVIPGVGFAGFGESLRVAGLDGSANRALGRRLLVRIQASIGLTQSRNFLIGGYPNPPIDHDSYSQSYRIETQYNASDAFNTAVGLGVNRNVLVNIPHESTSMNNELRSYRVDWRWSYRMLRGLTASQTNSIGADYLHYVFLPANDRLSMEYNVATTLNAVLSPRFQLDVRHNARHEPRGAYTELSDGVTYLSRSEVNDNYTLAARLSYAPSSAFSFHLEPNYLASERDATVGRGLAPTRRTRSLNFSGGASVNVPLGPKGRLTGDVYRTYRADRTLNYNQTGFSLPDPGTESDFWNGSLMLSWDL